MKLKGENGYIDYYKKKYLKFSIILLLLVVTIYVIGKIFAPNHFIYFMVGSALMILPAAQYITKYLLFSRYKSASSNMYQALQDISDQLLIFSDLIIVQGKKTIYCDFAVLSDQQIVVYFNPKGNKSQDKQKTVKEIIQNLYQKKGYQIPVEVIDNEDAYLTFIKQNVKGTLNNVNVETQEQLGRIIIQNAV